MPARIRAVLTVYDGEGRKCAVALLDRQNQLKRYGATFDLDDALAHMTYLAPGT